MIDERTAGGRSATESAKPKEQTEEENVLGRYLPNHRVDALGRRVDVNAMPLRELIPRQKLVEGSHRARSQSSTFAAFSSGGKTG